MVGVVTVNYTNVAAWVQPRPCDNFGTMGRKHHPRRLARNATDFFKIDNNGELCSDSGDEFRTSPRDRVEARLVGRRPGLVGAGDMVAPAGSGSGRRIRRSRRGPCGVAKISSPRGFYLLASTPDS